ncbi:MAG TPA: magnesium transporter CorA family protein [Steroidobacteraceae bacterium]|nr:magnesium transporter CorA family protein [Steroidobacteraceae bacterium]HRX88607.1 magnesium transporter CorA family protein [Steroidobacteraceae bacterium]
MLSAFLPQAQGLVRTELPDDALLPDEAIWFDLIEPTPIEEERVEKHLAIDVPTRDEMREIEASNRLYEEDGTLYMTATVVTKLESDLPENTQITFILMPGNKLVTNRYVDPLPFRRFIAYAARHPNSCGTAPGCLAGLLEAIVNRIADVIERVATDLDVASAEVFAASGRRRGVARDFRKVLEDLGQDGELVSKARESLVSLGRLLAFLQQSTTVPLTQDTRSRFRSVSRDVLALSDHASFLGTKTSFILDATLGMISIDQNNILKIFSMVTVFLLPPSVIAAIFGMNFAAMPWLRESWGFSAAMAMMLVAAIVPFVFFKRKGWL